MDPDAGLRSVILTDRQRRVLWLLSVGHTREDIAREIPGETFGGVKSACTRIFRTLGADTAAQAVRNGLLDGHIGPYEDCGSLTAYRRHIKRDEVVCPACKRGNRERLETEAALRNRRAQLNEAEIRLLRAFDAGRTVAQICTAWNVGHRVVKDLTASAYGALGVSHLPMSVRREAALREAGARGLLRMRPPVQPVIRAKQITLTNTQVRVLTELETGASISDTAKRLGMHVGTVSTRLSEAYRRLDVAWMEKADRRPAALRKARELGLLPETATT